MNLSILPCISNLYYENLQQLLFINKDTFILDSRRDNYFIIKTINTNLLFYIYSKDVKFNNKKCFTLDMWFFILNKYLFFKKNNININFDLPIPYFSEQKLVNFFGLLLSIITNINSVILIYKNVEDFLKENINNCISILNFQESIQKYKNDLFSLLKSFKDNSIPELYNNYEDDNLSSTLFNNNILKTFVEYDELLNNLINENKSSFFLIIQNSNFFHKKYKNLKNVNFKINQKQFCLLKENIKKKRPKTFDLEQHQNEDVKKLIFKNIILLFSLQNNIYYFYLNNSKIQSFEILIDNKFEYNNVDFISKNIIYLKNNIYQELLLMIEMKIVNNNFLNIFTNETKYQSFSKSFKNITIQSYGNMTESFKKEIDILNSIDKNLFLIYIYYTIYFFYYSKNTFEKRFNYSWLDSLFEHDIALVLNYYIEKYYQNNSDIFLKETSFLKKLYSMFTSKINLKLYFLKVKNEDLKYNVYNKKKKYYTFYRKLKTVCPFKNKFSKSETQTIDYVAEYNFDLKYFFYNEQTNFNSIKYNESEETTICLTTNEVESEMFDDFDFDELNNFDLST